MVEPKHRSNSATDKFWASDYQCLDLSLDLPFSRSLRKSMKLVLGKLVHTKPPDLPVIPVFVLRENGGSLTKSGGNEKVPSGLLYSFGSKAKKRDHVSRVLKRESYLHSALFVVWRGPENECKSIFTSGPISFFCSETQSSLYYSKAESIHQ